VSKHTKGPWVAKSYGKYGEWQVETFDRQRIIAPKIGGMSGEDEANAHLIASAPAMLDALRKAADRLAICCELQPDQKERDTIWAWVEEARNALPRGTP